MAKISLFFSIFLFLLDRVSKFLAYTSLTPLSSSARGLGVVLFINAKSFVLSYAQETYVLSFFLLCVLFFFAVSIRRARGASRLGMLLISLGAFSNIGDRFLFGGVIDYILIYHAVINISDLMILGGVILQMIPIHIQKMSQSNLV